jgi:hypothetical protein
MLILLSPRSVPVVQIGTPAAVDPPAPVLVPVVGARHFARVPLERSGELDLRTTVTVVEAAKGDLPAGGLGGCPARAWNNGGNTSPRPRGA